MRKTAFASAIAMLSLGSGAAQAADASSPCLTQLEATALVTAVLPDIVDGIAKKCATALPETAALRGGLAPMLDRYRPAADAAWPQASLAFAKMGGKEFKGVDPKLIRPLIGPMMAETVAADIKPAECPQIDTIIGGLAPLPAQNIADVFVAVLELDKGKGTPMAICPVSGKTAA